MLNKIKRKIREIFKKEVVMTPLEEEDAYKLQEEETDPDLNSKELQKKFVEETGKNAVWGGRLTKQYKEWANAQED